MESKRGRSKQKHHFQSRKKHGDVQEPLENEENSPVLGLFRQFSKALDDKHDRYERIVKIGRDVTIESKRIIFLLHNRDTDIESKKEEILQAAEKRLNQLIKEQFLAISKELNGHDPYLYLRAYTAGLQEFIEALLFYQYLKDEEIQEWQVLNEKFTYNIEETGEKLELLFPQVEFILGMADFTGELMRKCINNIGSGNVDDCFKICGFVKYILSGFLGVNCLGHREIGRKLYTLKQSLAKMEMVCYNIRVRGKEVPEHMLAIVNTSENISLGDEDEGFY